MIGLSGILSPGWGEDTTAGIIYIWERERERERERESLLEASFLRMSLLEARIIKINRTIEVQKCMIFFAVALTWKFNNHIFKMTYIKNKLVRKREEASQKLGNGSKPNCNILWLPYGMDQNSGRPTKIVILHQKQKQRTERTKKEIASWSLYWLA